VGSLTDWYKVSVGSDFGYAIKTDGTLWAIGAASFGKLGNNNITVDVSSPIQIGSDTSWYDIAAQSSSINATKE
jgi:alpha-tubulin suppressor-like RCC1 family protein